MSNFKTSILKHINFLQSANMTDRFAFVDRSFLCCLCLACSKSWSTRVFCCIQTKQSKHNYITICLQNAYKIDPQLHINLTNSWTDSKSSSIAATAVNIKKN